MDAMVSVVYRFKHKIYAQYFEKSYFFVTLFMNRLGYFVVMCVLLTGSSNLSAQAGDQMYFNTIGDHPSFVQDNARLIARGQEMSMPEKTMKEDSDTLAAGLGRRIPIVSLPLREIKVNSPFGIRRDPMNRNKKRMHNGMDLKANYEEVYSMLPGKVSRVGYSETGGNYITVNHGACVCSYLHLSMIKVSLGQHVRAGQVIAISGNSGKRTTGPHLHLACRLGDEKGQFFDPAILLTFVRQELTKN